VEHSKANACLALPVKDFALTTLMSNGRARAVGCYLSALLLCLLVLGSVFDVRSEARQWPWTYQGDSMFYHVVAKSVTEGGWLLDVPLLGTPGALNLRDVPTSDNNLHVLMLWLLALGTSHYAMVLNNFFLLSFPLVFMSALVVMRHFRVGWPASVCASLLYAFAPFHFTRGEHHLFLSAYWPVPLATLVMLWVSREGLWPERADVSAKRRWKLLLSTLICLVLAATGYYYAFFACFFFFVAGIVAAVRHRAWRGLCPALALIAVISTGLAVNLWPSFVHFGSSGTSAVIRRQPSDADQYALRIAQMVLPVSGHRLFALDVLKSEYNRRPMINDNDHAALGFAGALGFLGLVWWFFFRKPSAEGLSEPGTRGLLHHLSIFSLGGVLFGTIGGFGSLVAFFGLPQVRGYNRISVYLSFFALFALALWLDEFLRRHATSLRRQGAAYVVLAAVMLLALADQISPRMLPDYKGIEEQFLSDATFVRQIESRVPRGARIFQLPFMPFPESSQVARMRDYDLLRGYLHSDHLRWSYGTIRGSEGNAWLRHTASQPVDTLIETLVWAGFSGVYVDRHGFGDNGERIEGALDQVLQDTSIHSPDQRLVFYDLTHHRARVERHTPRDEWQARREAALRPPLVVWLDGFYEQEGTSDNTWRWAGSKGRVGLINGATRTQSVRLDMSLVGNDGGDVTIHTPLLRQPISVKMNERGQTVHLNVMLPPGRHHVNFASSAQPVYPADDFRDLVFSVHNLKLTSLSQPLRPDVSSHK
jgi:phosphoglycerol transferase